MTERVEITRVVDWPGHVSLYRDGRYIGRVWWRGEHAEAQHGAELRPVTVPQAKGEPSDAWQERVMAAAEAVVVEMARERGVW